MNRFSNALMPLTVSLALFAGIAGTAIMTHYPGVVDLRFFGGQVTIDGRRY